ncbi:MAG: DNA (cytosine-5-)-methyltransferase [Acidimicrobiales bacterium]
MANAGSIPSTFRFIDLFAGIGGFHHALSGLGGECVLAVELDAEARSVYAASFPDMEPAAIKADIRSLTRASIDPDADELDEDAIRQYVPEHDVLCAGFPCQPFSKSGFQKGVRDRTRGTLFFDVMSIVIARQPRFVILENVRNLAGPRHADTWATIIESLRDAGYVVSDRPAVLSPHMLSKRDGGAPQVRDRVFILAHRARPGMAAEDRTSHPLVGREPSAGWDPHKWKIAQHLEPNVDLDEYGVRPEEATWLAAWQHFVQMIDDEMLPGFPIWVDAFQPVPDITDDTPDWKADFLHKNALFYRTHREEIDAWRQLRFGPLNQTVTEFPPSRRKFEWQARKAQPSAASRDLEGLVAHMRPSGIRVKPPSYLPALVAITQTSVLGPKVTGANVWRRLTPREAAALQGVPFDGFVRSGVSDKAIYKQLGNAVNVGVVQHAAQALFVAAGEHWGAAAVLAAG